MLDQFYNAARTFQYDYIYLDAVFLLVWLFILLKNGKYAAVIFGLVIAPVIYFIDGQIWWNKLFASGVYVREYWIGGIQMPHPLGSYLWLKFGADFMMTISYAIYTFPWVWIMFENIRNWNKKEVIKYTSIFFGFWILTPLLSILLPLNDTIVQSVRHTSSNIWLYNLIIGYLILLFVYRKEIKTVGRVFLVGVVGALIMELPLYIFGIRPTGIAFIVLEALFLLNQGVPWLFLVWDKGLRSATTRR